MDIRFVDGGDFGTGPARAWFRLTRPLIDDDPPSALARTVAAADFGNGISRVVDFDAYLFVNTDLTVHLHREPAGEWVLLDARTRSSPTAPDWRTRSSATSAAGSGCVRSRCSSPHVDAMPGQVASRRTRRRRPDQHDTRCAMASTGDELALVLDAACAVLFHLDLATGAVRWSGSLAALTGVAADQAPVTLRGVPRARASRRTART